MTHTILLVRNFSIMGKEKQISLITKREILTDKINQEKMKQFIPFFLSASSCMGILSSWLCLWVWNLTTNITTIIPSRHKENGIVSLQLIRKYKPKTPSDPVLIQTQPETRGLKID